MSRETNAKTWATTSADGPAAVGAFEQGIRGQGPRFGSNSEVRTMPYHWKLIAWTNLLVVTATS